MIEAFAGARRTGRTASRSSASTPALDTPTGGRVARAARPARGRDASALTYADGVADIDLARAARLPRASHGGDRDDDRRPAAQPVGRRAISTTTTGSSGFDEKPRLEHWVNGGFFFFEPGVPRLPGRADSVLEREPLERAGRRRASSRAYRHDGFWDCMDTYKDAVDAQRPLGVGRSRPGASGSDSGRRGLVRCRAGHRRRAGSSAPGSAKALLERGARGGLARPPGPRRRPSTLALLGIEDLVPQMRADARRRRVAGAGAAQAPGDDRVPPRRRDDRRHRRRVAAPAFETNVRGTWTLLDACRGRGSSGWSSPPRPRGKSLWLSMLTMMGLAAGERPGKCRSEG